MNDESLYISFVLHAIYGRLQEADTLMRFAGPQIRRLADAINFVHTEAKKESRKPIYRGVLLDPQEPFKLDPSLTFMSWSEDPDVARWFALPDSIISTYTLEQKPNLRGYVFELEAPRSRVLFHHSWLWVFDGDLSRFALQHPFMGAEGARQIAWSLRTQHEVITEPCAMPEAQPVDDFPGSSLHQLEARLAPPWITEGL